MSNINSCAVAHRFAIGISSMQLEPLQHYDTHKSLRSYVRRTLTVAADVCFWSALLATVSAEGWATGGTAVAVTIPRGSELLATAGGALTIT